MKLIYRGTTFNYDPSLSVARHAFQQVRQPGAAYNLRYCGTTYCVAPNAKSEEFPA